MLPAVRRGRPTYPDVLTPREWEVLALIKDGLTNPQIAQRLGITESGARFQVSEILSKLGVDSRQADAGYSATLKQGRLVLPFLAFAAFWKRAVRSWSGRAAITAAAVLTMALVVWVGFSAIRGGKGEGTQSRAVKIAGTVRSRSAASPALYNEQGGGPSWLHLPGHLAFCQCQEGLPER